MTPDDPDDKLARALHDAVSNIEPRDALAEIRSRTAAPASRSWLLTGGGAALAVAAVVTTIVLAGQNAGRPAPRPDAAGSPTAVDTPSTPSASPADPSPTSSPGTGRATAVYCLGETPQGTRLYREFRPAPAGTKNDPMGAAQTLLMETPSDTDYRTLWPAGSIVDTSFDGVGVDGLASVVLADASYAERPAGMTADDAEMAVQQVLYTIQAALHTRVPVSFLLPGGNPLPTVFGVPTNEPLAEGSALDTLAHVSISDPAEGVTASDELVVEGAANSNEANLAWSIDDASGNEVSNGTLMAEGYQANKLFPFSGTLDISDLAPGAHLLTIRSDDPSGAGLSHADTRTFVVE